MIKDKLENIYRYKINSAFEVFKERITSSNNLLDIEAPFKAIPLDYVTKVFDLDKFENHKKFIDVHYIISGSELIGLTSIDMIKPNMEYDEENDYQLFKGKVNESILLKEGDFLLLFPGEAHVTGGVINNISENIKKIVYKVPLNKVM